MPSSKPHPPVVGKVTHHSIELYWDLEKKEKRQGPQEQWLRFSIEEEDPKTHTYGIIYTGYATKHVIEGLEPRTLYRFRLKVTSPSGECEYSRIMSVSTTSEYTVLEAGESRAQARDAVQRQCPAFPRPHRAFLLPGLPVTCDPRDVHYAFTEWETADFVLGLSWSWTLAPGRSCLA
ncbi:hypothetical protein GHT09_002334 [Marmota monax]|nr:hypothetical protein GHT09_002334 [Marmota monax]